MSCRAVTRRTRQGSLLALGFALFACGSAFAEHLDFDSFIEPKLPAFVSPAVFDRDHSRSAFRNPRGVDLELRTVGGRTTFRCGEAIRIEFVIRSKARNTYYFDEDGLARSYDYDHDAFFCEALPGAVDARFDPSLDFGGGMVALEYASPKPTVICTGDLNEWIAFDHPGRFRVFVTITRLMRFRGHSRSRWFGPDDITVPTTSTVLTLTIRPAEPAWAHSVVVGAMRPKHSYWDDITWDPSVRVLDYLRTPEAAVALLQIMELRPRMQYPEDIDWLRNECHSAILNSPHREELMAQTRHDIADPHIEMSDQLLSLYSDLLSLENHPGPMKEGYSGTSERQQWRQVEQEALKSLATKDRLVAASSRKGLRQFEQDEVE